jgi:hypothetical protein
LDHALEIDLATPAREITSRHGVDKRSLLPLAARRDAVARNATSRMASRNQRCYSAETSKPRSVAVSAINAVAACTTGAAKFAQRAREKLVAHENGKMRAGHCGSFMIHVNNSNAFSPSSASWTIGHSALSGCSSAHRSLRTRSTTARPFFLNFTTSTSNQAHMRSTRRQVSSRVVAIVSARIQAEDSAISLQLGPLI